MRVSRHSGSAEELYYRSTGRHRDLPLQDIVGATLSEAAHYSNGNKWFEHVTAEPPNIGCPCRGLIYNK